MPRPARRRRGLVVALIGAALLSACTGNADDHVETAPTPAVAPTAATATAGSVLSAAVSALADTKATGVAAREAAFVGPALESANAWAKTLPGRTAAERAAAVIDPTGATVVGVSRLGDTPKQLIVRAKLKGTGAAVLALLVADSGTDFKVAALTPMLPEARLDALDPVSTGSVAIGSGTGSGSTGSTSGLAADPETVIKDFADSVKYPDPVETRALVADPLSAQLRQSAASQASAIKASGAFLQTHEPKGVLGGLRLKDGSGAVVFAHLVRHDEIALRRASHLTPSKDFTALTGIKEITTEASLTSNEIIAIVIPATGPARIVASSDQLVAGTGR